MRVEFGQKMTHEHSDAKSPIKNYLFQEEKILGVPLRNQAFQHNFVWTLVKNSKDYVP